MRWLPSNSLIIALVLTVVATRAGVAQDATAAAPIDTGGLFVSSPELIQSTPIGIFPPGDGDSLAEVGRSVAPDGSGLLLVVRNNINERVRRATASARVSHDGSIVALGSASVLMPSEVPPGGVGLILVPFDAGLDPVDILAAKVRIDISGEPTFYGYETVDVIDVVVEADEIFIGLASRSGGGMSTVRKDVAIVCLIDDADAPIGSWATFQLDQPIERDGAATAVVDQGIAGCDGDVIAAAVGTDGRY